MIYRLAIDAFALTPETAQAFKELRDDRAMARSRVTVMGGGLAGAVAHYADKTTAQVVLVEEDDDDATLLARLDQLAEVCEPGTRVVVVGKLNDIKLYRQLVSRGVSEYLLAPVSARLLLDTLAGMFQDPGAAPKGRVLAVWGVRGGTGASTLAQNVAWSLGRHLQEPVIYLDLDLAFGTSVLAFNIDAKQTVAEALAHPDRLDPVLLERFMVAHDDHLQVLASPADPRAALAVIEPESIDRLLDLLARMGAAVVVDLPHQWAEWSQHVLASADEVVAVASPDLVNLRDAKALFEQLAGQRGGNPAPRLVLNRMDAARKTQLSPKDFEETMGVQPALILPFEPQLFGQAANNGQMLGEVAKTHKVVEQIAAFAASLAGRAPVARARKAAGKGLGLLSWLKR